MEYLGLFCLGVFAGTLTVMGLRKTPSLTDWRQAFVVILPVLLSGAAMVFVERFRYSPAVGAFPLGLVASLLWSCIGTALDHLKLSDAGAKAVGWAHVAAAVGVVAGAVPLVVVPAVEQVLAESAMSRETRIRELQEARGRANWGSPSRSTAGAAERVAAASAPSSASSAASSPLTSASAASAAASR
jgi:hypothetical protein